MRERNGWAVRAAGVVAAGCAAVQASAGGQTYALFTGAPYVGCDWSSDCGSDITHSLDITPWVPFSGFASADVAGNCWVGFGGTGSNSVNVPADGQAVVAHFTSDNNDPSGSYGFGVSMGSGGYMELHSDTSIGYVRVNWDWQYELLDGVAGTLTGDLYIQGAGWFTLGLGSGSWSGAIAPVSHEDFRFSAYHYQGQGYHGHGTSSLTITFEVSSVPFPPMPEDLNGDGFVDGADLGILLGAWGTGNATADLNHDGTVDGGDLGLLLGAWTV